MNKHGQSLAIFIILIPVILFVISFLYDVSYITIQKTKFNNTSKMIIKDCLKKETKEDCIKELYVLNEYKNDNLIISYENNILNIKNTLKINCLFDNILKNNIYQINISAYEENNDIIIKENKKG